MTNDQEELLLLGAAVLSVQKLEYGIYGIAAHASHTPAAAKERRFRALTPGMFLEGDPRHLKATLGQLVEVFGEQFLIKTSDFDKYVEDRNLICHNYWRLTRTENKGGGGRLENRLDFLRTFVERSDHLTKIIKGLYAHLMIAAAKKEGRESEIDITDVKQQDMDAYLISVAKFLDEKK